MQPLLRRKVGLRLETHKHDDKVARWDGDGQDKEGRETPENWHGRFDSTVLWRNAEE